MTDRAIGVGLIGAGNFGRQLGLGTRRVDDLDLIALVEPDDEAAAEAVSLLAVPRLGSIDELLGRTDIAAVIVATPHATHHPIALDVFAAGRHCFVEKPLTIGASEAKAVIRAADDAGRVLVVGHVARLLPLVQAAFERLDAGVIGEPRAAWHVRHQPLRRRGWMASRESFGMLLHSPAVHDIDLMNRILGTPESVTAVAAPVIQPDVEYPDVAAVIVRYASGAVGSLGATVSDPLYGPSGTSSARIVGDRGGMAFDIATGIIDIQVQDAAPEQIRVDVERWGIDGAITAELTSFAAAIRGQTAPFVLPHEALAAVAIVDAAERSISSGQPVELTPSLSMSER